MSNGIGDGGGRSIRSEGGVGRSASGPPHDQCFCPRWNSQLLPSGAAQPLRPAPLTWFQNALPASTRSAESVRAQWNAQVLRSLGFKGTLAIPLGTVGSSC
eukprot:3350721-Rhodomonas_salina.2